MEILSREERALAGVWGRVCLALAVCASPVLAQSDPEKAAPPAAGEAQATGAAVSEDLLFEDIPVVITASRHEQKASEAPASVAIITADEIERQGYRTLAEALQSVPGIYINYDRNYTYIGVRGFARPGDYNSRVQVQVDGHPMNDNVWDQAFVGEDLGVDMSNVDRVEVVYGPGAALYGSNALFATINVITRKPVGARGTELALEGGGLGRGKVRLSHGGEAGGWNYAGSAGALNIGGGNLYFPEYDALGQNGGLAERTDYEKASQVYGKLEKGDLSVQVMSVYRIKGIPTGAFFTVFNDDTSRTTDVRSFLDMEYHRSLREGMDLTVHGAYDEYRYWGTYRYDAGGGVLVDNIDQSAGRWASQEAQIDYRVSPRHHLTFGQSFVRNFEAHLENHDEDPRVVYNDVGRAFSEYSVYVQHEYVPRRGLQLTAGARYDDYSTFGSAVSPRLALVYGPAENWRLKLLAGRAFRAPGVYELFSNDPTFVPAQSLDPEVVASYELAYEARLGARFDLRSSLYQDRVSDLISLTSVGPGISQFQNVDRAVNRGGEIQVRARFADGTNGYLSYSYMKAEDGDGQRLTNYPPQSIKAGVSVPFGQDRWRLSANLQYYEERLTLTGTQSPDVFLTNVTLVAPLFHRNARLSASVFNLFDRNYGLPASTEHQDLVLIPQDGRSFVLRAVWNF
jgi:iron complex outermembrane receptor protein